MAKKARPVRRCFCSACRSAATVREIADGTVRCYDVRVVEPLDNGLGAVMACNRCEWTWKSRSSAARALVRQEYSSKYSSRWQD